MGTFQIEGGHELSGEITPQGAKNEALQILCAVLLTPEKVVIDNIPDIRDVNKLIDLLQDLGFKFSQDQVDKASRKEGVFKGMSEYVFRR